jgi:hypothetical protein
MEEIRKIASDLGNRIKGTYGATFILVWSVFNWRLIYIILNFDKSYTLKHKINVLNCYLAHDKGHLNTFWYPLGMSVLSIIGYYLMNYLTFAISGVFNLKLKPLIQDKIDKIKSTVVSKELYDTLNAQHKELQDKYKAENEGFIRDTAELKKIKDENEMLILENQSLKAMKENLEKHQDINFENLNTKLDEIKSNGGFYGSEPTSIFNRLWERKIGEVTEVFSVKETTVFVEGRAKYKIQNFLRCDFGILKFDLLKIENNEIISVILTLNNSRGYVGVEKTENQSSIVEYCLHFSDESFNRINNILNS